MIRVFINPGTIRRIPRHAHSRLRERLLRKWVRARSRIRCRSTQYDTVSDRYLRFLREEVIAEVARNTISVRTPIAGDHRRVLRRDLRVECRVAEAGQFSRVITRIGTYTGIQWKEDPKKSRWRAGLP